MSDSYFYMDGINYNEWNLGNGKSFIPQHHDNSSNDNDTSNNCMATVPELPVVGGSPTTHCCVASRILSHLWTQGRIVVKGASRKRRRVEGGN